MQNPKDKINCSKIIHINLDMRDIIYINYLFNIYYFELIKVNIYYFDFNIY